MIDVGYTPEVTSPAQRRRAARHQQQVGEETARRGPSAGRKKAITVDAIVEAAFDIIRAEGYAALTMRRVAAALETGPASLYAHVVNKDDLDDLLIGRICAEVELPEPDSSRWREQVVDVCGQLRDRYLRYPGVSQAALSVVPTNVETLRVSDGMLGILLAGSVSPRRAAWTVDALLLYVGAQCWEESSKGRGADDLRQRFASLPDAFPHTKRHAEELTSGTADERFSFTVGLMLDGLADRS